MTEDPTHNQTITSLSTNAYKTYIDKPSSSGKQYYDFFSRGLENQNSIYQALILP